MATPDTFETFAATHVGNVRSENEDRFLSRPSVGLWAVADGMGGHAAGAVASAAVVSALDEIAPQPTASDLLRGCEQQLQAANRTIRAIAARQGLGTIGATVVTLLADDRHYACLWAGDSRAYLIRQGAAAQITHDHTEAARLVAEGRLSEEEARHWPGRNIVTRAVGAADVLALDLSNGELRPGDVFVLCSDGLTGHMEAPEIARIAGSRRPEDACREMIDLALQRGGHDNVTVIVIRHAEGSTQLSPGPSP